ncbi:MAG TPA: substrate binding domain-containing protein [Thalassobaculum sp.]
MRRGHPRRQAGRFEPGRPQAGAGAADRLRRAGLCRAARRPRTPADLSQHDCLLYTFLATQNEWRFVDRSGGPHAVRVDGRLQIDNGDAGRAVLLGGMCVGLMPTFLVGEDINAGRLVHLLPDYDNVFGGVYAVYPHSRHLSPKVRAFVDHLSERFGPEPYWDLRCRGGRGDGPRERA